MEITIAIGPGVVKYKVAKTTAPTNYDGTVIPLYDGGDGTRYILVQEHDWTWQLSRNRSGLYTLEETEDIPLDTLTYQLWTRIGKEVN